MSLVAWTEADTDRARQVWATYRRQNDLSERLGQTAGIDPVSGRIWFGESAQDVVERMRADGADALLYFVRVGSDYYVRKGGR